MAYTDCESPIGLRWALSFVPCAFFFLLALQPPSGVVFYSPLVGFSLLACEVS